MRRGVQSVAYGNPLYQKILASGEIPQRLHFTPADPWPGDAQAGIALLSPQASMFDRAEQTALRHAATALRNLRAIGTDAARIASVRLIETGCANSTAGTKMNGCRGIWARASRPGSVFTIFMRRRR